MKGGDKRTIIHVQAGSKDWKPTQRELEHLAELAHKATLDPIGACVLTPAGAIDATIEDVQEGENFDLAIVTVKVRT